MKKYKFESIGVMIDVSKNSVISLDGRHRFMPLLDYITGKLDSIQELS